MTVNNNISNSPSLIDLRAMQYADHALSKLPEVVQGKLVTPAMDHLSENGAKYIGLALAALSVYIAFRWLAKKGETQPLPVREYKLLTLDYENGTTKTIELHGPKTIQDSELEGLKHFEIRKIDVLENHIKNLEGLKTNEDLVAWLITYQHLTCDGNGRDVVGSTVGAGLATALRGAMAVENIGVVNKTATLAIIDTLIELSRIGELPLLNYQDKEAHLRFQNIETKNLQLKTLSTLSPEIRSHLAWLASGVQGLSKAALGLSKSLPEL